MFCWKQRLRPTLLSSLWSYRTASTQRTDVPQNPLKLSQQAQRAAWAVKIINTIQESNPEECIYSPSLRQKLQSLTTPHPSYAFDPQVKKEILQMFNEGIKISDQVFRQERFLNARLEKSTEYKTIFCPNHLVTKQMFQLVDKFSYLLVCGNFGISKTISLALYSLLAQHVSLFYYQAECKKAASTQQDEQLQKKMKDTIRELQKNKVLKKIPKHWYWTINRKDIKEKGWRSIQQALISQTYELSPSQQEDLWKCQSLSEFMSRLKYYYPQSKVDNRVIIDQINGLASLMRQWNEFLIGNRVQIQKIKELDQESRSYLEKQIIAKQKQFLLPAQELIGFFDEIQRLCNKGYILNSSVNIEKSLFMNPKILPHQQLFPLKFQQLGLLKPLILPILGNHDEVNQIQMRYSEDLRQNWGKNDFFHFFWFEVESLLKQKVPTERIATAGRIFLSVAQERQGKGYYRTIYIKGYLKKDFTQIQAKVKKFFNAVKSLPDLLVQNDASCRECRQRLSEFFPPDTLSKMFTSAGKTDKEGQGTPASPQKANKEHPLAAIFKEMFEKFDKFCFDEEKKRVISFMKKGDYEKKLKFMAAIHFLAEVAAEKKNTLQFPMQLLGIVAGEDTAAHFLSEEHNQQLLPINRNIDSKETVDFLWTPQQFLQLTTEAIFPHIYKLHNTYLMPFFRQSNADHPVFRGIIFELLFLHQLNPKTTIIFMMYQANNIFTDFPAQLSACMSFLPFNEYIIKQMQPGKKRSLQYLHTEKRVAKKDLQQVIDVDLHFAEILAFCSSNQEKFVSGIPKYKQKLVYNNTSVDFVLARKVGSTIIFNTFDITVSKQLSQKIADAKVFLGRIAKSKNHKYKFQFSHTIMCPDNACKETIFFEDGPKSILKIKFSSIDKVKILSSAHPTQCALLETLQQINKKLGTEAD